MADLIDPTQTGNYPVVLSDRLLGKATDDIFTGVRCTLTLLQPSFSRHANPSTPDNHKPSSIPSDARARLKPSIPGQTSSYDLNVLSSSSSSTTHAFAGTRTTQNGKYVLYFDAENQRFVLDRVDSTFNMNLTRTPENSDPGALERRFPHIDESGKKKEKKERAKSPIRKKKEVKKEEKREFATKAERRRAKDANNLALPTGGATPTPTSSAKPKPKPKAKPAEDDEEEDEGDDLLLVEYPDGGGPKSQNRDFSPALTSVRRFDEFMDQRESEAEDADDESLNESDAGFELPSPVNQPAHEPEDMDLDEEEPEADDTRGGSDMEGDLEDDLEKDLAEAFEEVGNGGSSPVARGDHGDESEISEED